MSDEFGVDVEVVDEAQSATPPTQTDTTFLLIATAAAQPIRLLRRPKDARDLFPVDTGIYPYADAFFNEGGARLYVVSTFDDSAGVGTGLDQALAKIDDSHGPGQIVAPAMVAPADVTQIATFAWDTNRVYIANGADAALTATLEAIVAALQVPAAGDGRFAGVEADTLLIPGDAGGATREVSASIVKAALIARSDITSRNPNLAAAGANGKCRYVIGIKAERTKTARETLATAQINVFRAFFDGVRAYGFKSAADLDLWEHWWDLSGSRTVMAARALETVVADEVGMFGQIDGGKVFLAKYEGALRGQLAELARLGALYERQGSPGYSVTVSEEINPGASVAQGVVTAQILLRTSPFAQSLKVNITRRAITQEV